MVMHGRLVKYRAACVSVVLLHLGLMAWSSSRHSPTWDEVGHLPAGISHWTLGRFDLYRVNPPLVRMIAALPVLLAHPQTDWTHPDKQPGDRWEFQPVGVRFLAQNSSRIFELFTVARWACLPFSLVGAVVCYAWARELHGSFAGLLALLLWCTCPNILGHGQLLTPDVGATALGAGAAYLFWRWLRVPTWPRACLAGMTLGLAELAKTTWILSFFLWPVLWLAWNWPERQFLSWRQWRILATQLAFVGVLAVYVVNLLYGFEGSFERLGNYEFVSEALSGRAQSLVDTPASGNRFRGSWLANLPIPFPSNYILGIDAQKSDFERGMWSTLRGEWRHGGWWYYYLYGLAIKVPLGTWLLVLLATVASVCCNGYSVSWRDRLCVLAPPFLVLALVSSQTGFSHHLRYVLPVLPFMFVWASTVAAATVREHAVFRFLTLGAVIWSMTSSLSVYPHSLSYFNELAGGPVGGPAHLGSSNADWGQDLLYLKRWLDKHPDAQPFYLAWDVYVVDPRLAGIEAAEPPPGPSPSLTNRVVPPEKMGPLPGWHAVSVNRLRSRTEEYAYFLRLKPTDMVGYSIYIYHVTPDEANRVRREYGLPGAPSSG